MPQDTLRSVVYRSFVTCDDPKGVVECKTVRKPKTDSQKVEDRVKNAVSRKNSNLSSSDKVSRGSTEELQNLSSFQIMEVSRGAQKLTDVVDSWSNGVSFDKKSKKIAQDLLKGALDLQDSIAMLGKLQEASRYMGKLNRKKKEKVEEEKKDYNHMMKRRISIDGSTRDCYDELREAIVESFARQNLFPKSSSTRENHYLDERKSDLHMDLKDFPSTSSSQSSQIFSHDFASSDSSPLKVQPEKPKQLNLVAKLMGLEEVPSNQLQSVSQKHVEKNELSNRRSYLSDLELPRMRKPQFAAQKVVQERRKLEEMIETMQFKGLFEKKSTNREKCGEDCDYKASRISFSEMGSPIVIIRPLHVPKVQNDYCIHKEKPLKCNQMPSKRKEEFPVNAEVAPKLGGKSQRVQEKLSHTNSKLMSPKLQKKESVKRIDKVLKVSPVIRAETKTLKPQEPSRTRILENTTTLKLGKHDKVSNVSKNYEKAASSDKIMRRAASLNSSKQKKTFKDDKLDCNPSPATVETKLPIDLAGKMERDEAVIPSKEIAVEPTNEADDYMFDECTKTSSPPEFSMSIIEDSKSIDKENCMPNHNSPEYESCKIETNTRSLLLNNTSFLCLMDELFDSQTWGPKSCPTTLSHSYEQVDTKLLLDCANEMLERKRQWWTITTYPLSQTKSKHCLSLDHLVRQICDGIEDLMGYSKLSGEIVVVDVIYSMLERDLWCKRGLIGAWDMGWTMGHTLESVEEVVADIEKLVLSEIVEDAITNIAY